MGHDPKANSGSDTSAGVGSIPSRRVSHSEKSESDSVFENSEWLDSRQAAAYLRLRSWGALRTAIYQGRLVPSGYFGRCPRFKKTDLDRFLEISARRKNWRTQK